MGGECWETGMVSRQGVYDPEMAIVKGGNRDQSANGKFGNQGWSVDRVYWKHGWSQWKGSVGIWGGQWTSNVDWSVVDEYGN